MNLKKENIHVTKINASSFSTDELFGQQEASSPKIKQKANKISRCTLINGLPLHFTYVSWANFLVLATK